MLHLPGAAAEAVSLLSLLAVLAFAIIRPRGLPEAVAAVPAALLVLIAGAVTRAQALDVWHELASTLGFLAVILVLAHLCQEEGLFAYAGQWMGRRAHGSPKRLLLLVYVVASLTTAVLSLDATVVLLTPVVLATAARAGSDAEPHVYATAHLANAASLLLPVSNLTNLLAFRASHLSFGSFAALMAGPWLVAIAVDYGVVRIRFASELEAPRRRSAAGEEEDLPAPRLALAVVALVLVGFAVCSPLGVDVVWPALAGTAVLLAVRLVRAQSGPGKAGDGDDHAPADGGRAAELLGSLRAANPLFLLFVLGLGIVVRGAEEHGLLAAMARIVPSGSGPLAVVGIAVVAALAANLVNNLPATLMLIPILAGAGPVPVLAALIGVNVGPNLTYVGSLATLLWRRILSRHGRPADLAEFTRLGVAAVPVTLVLAPLALWAAAALTGL